MARIKTKVSTDTSTNTDTNTTERVGKKRGIKPSDGIRRPFGMTKYQEKFALLILQGFTQWQAYMQVYDPTVSKKDAERRGCNIAKSKAVKAYLDSKATEQLEIKKAEAKAVWDWNDALKFLTDVASGKQKEKCYGHGQYYYEKEVDIRTRMKAIELMGNLWKMSMDIQKDTNNEPNITVNVINDTYDMQRTLKEKMEEVNEDVIEVSEVTDPIADVM